MLANHSSELHVQTEKKEIYFECSLHIIIASRSELQVVMMMKYKSVHEEKTEREN